MKDPMHFIAQTIDNYPGLDLEELREAFEEVKLEMKRKDEN
jgi:exonuclease SbcD